MGFRSRAPSEKSSLRARNNERKVLDKRHKYQLKNEHFNIGS